jgi:hypothetical protein
VFSQKCNKRELELSQQTRARVHHPKHHANRSASYTSGSLTSLSGACRVITSRMFPLGPSTTTLTLSRCNTPISLHRQTKPHLSSNPHLNSASTTLAQLKSHQRRRCLRRHHSHHTTMTDTTTSTKPTLHLTDTTINKRDHWLNYRTRHTELSFFG